MLLRRERRKGKQRQVSSLMWSNKVRGCIEFQASACAAGVLGRAEQSEYSAAPIKSRRIRQPSPSREICPVLTEQKVGYRQHSGCHKAVNLSSKGSSVSHLSVPPGGFHSTTDARVVTYYSYSFLFTSQ